MRRPMYWIFTSICAVHFSMFSAATEVAASGNPQYRYHYTSLDNAMLPDGYTDFFGAKVIDNGKVYGTVSGGDCSSAVAVWQDGRVRVLVEGGSASTANDLGTTGGSVQPDCPDLPLQAALFRRGEIKPLTARPNEIFSFVFQLTNTGIAFVYSSDGTDDLYYLYRRGRAKPLDFGPRTVRFTPRVNGSGLVAGTYVQPGSNPFEADTRAFRLGRSGVKTMLDPRPTEPISWGEAINSRGDVLGYSFISNGREAIGVWRNRPGNPFKTYFVEGTSEFPTISNDLLWNEPGLIVITGALNDPDSYIVPRPGVRLNLTDITDNMPAGRVTVITDLNDRGDLLGFNYDPNTDNPEEDFLLQRVGHGQSITPALSAANQNRQAPSQAASWRLRRPELLAPRTNGKTLSMTR